MSEDEDVANERGRVLSADVADDVLVLQDLTKVRLFAIFLHYLCHCLSYQFSITHSFHIDFH